VRSRKVRREKIGEGDIIDFDGGKMYVLNPKKGTALEDGNENSIVLKLSYKKFSVLFCADASGPALERLTGSHEKFLASDVIKVPHHGGDVGGEDTARIFFSAVRAKTAVISVAKMNKYKAPSRKTLTALKAFTPMIYMTKDNGAIIISTCGAAPYVVIPCIELS